MQPIDDEILEYLADEGGMTPMVIEDRGVTGRHHASRRCSELANYGLVENPARGFYKITDEGRAYLKGELDASELEPVDDS